MQQVLNLGFVRALLIHNGHRMNSIPPKWTFNLGGTILVSDCITLEHSPVFDFLAGFDLDLEINTCQLHD